MLFEDCKTFKDLSCVMRDRFQMSLGDYNRFIRTYRRLKYESHERERAAALTTALSGTTNPVFANKGHAHHDRNTN